MAAFIPPCDFNTAILFVIFNRPETTKVVFDAIRHARPPRLYIAADGPRSHVTNEYSKCEMARAIVEQVDWPCEVNTLFRDSNLGCGRALSSAITWFFDREKEGIILEDDCLPSKSFFWYCQELLTKYRNDTRVMHIGGNNFLSNGRSSHPSSYYFSYSGHIWGWATWARAWRTYDFKLQKFQTINSQGYFNNFFLNPVEKYYRVRKFKQILSSELDTWDYQWDFARFINSGLAIVPSLNLVRNIGYGDSATHTTDSNHEYGKLETHELSFPLKHPHHVLRDYGSDKKYFKKLMKERIFSKLLTGK